MKLTVYEEYYYFTADEHHENTTPEQEDTEITLSDLIERLEEWTIEDYELHQSHFPPYNGQATLYTDTTQDHSEGGWGRYSFHVDEASAFEIAALQRYLEPAKEKEAQR